MVTWVQHPASQAANASSAIGGGRTAACSLGHARLAAGVPQLGSVATQQAGMVTSLPNLSHKLIVAACKPSSAAKTSGSLNQSRARDKMSRLLVLRNLRADSVVAVTLHSSD